MSMDRKESRRCWKRYLKLLETHRGFPIIYHELEGDQSQKVYEDDKLEVWTIPLDHRIYCNGYLFREKPKDRSA